MRVFRSILLSLVAMAWARNELSSAAMYQAELAELEAKGRRA